MQEKPVYWLTVASRDHVLAGKEKSFVQVSHGKPTPLEKMKVGDWIVYYSPKLKYNGSKACQRFTAIARISGEDVFQVSMSENFKPFRRKAEFLEGIHETEVRPLIPELDFVKDKEHWGLAFRNGFRQISKKDFVLICQKMSAD